MADTQKDDQTPEHVVGTMNIEVQEKMYEAFLSYVGRGIGICVVVLVLLYLVAG